MLLFLLAITRSLSILTVESFKCVTIDGTSMYAKQCNHNLIHKIPTPFHWAFDFRLQKALINEKYLEQKYHSGFGSLAVRNTDLTNAEFYLKNS